MPMLLAPVHVQWPLFSIAIMFLSFTTTVGNLISHLANETTLSANRSFDYQPRNACNIFNYCGIYGCCNSDNIVPCKCLPGFEPKEPNKWSSGKFSAGCKRKSLDLFDVKSFISFKNMKAESPIGYIVDFEEQCRNRCLTLPECVAYDFNPISTIYGGLENSTCWMWFRRGGLKNILEQVDNRYNLNLRIEPKDIDPIERSCKFCGTNVLPYPLSTGLGCGDPLYVRFFCDRNTSQLYFITSDALHRVTRVTPEVQTFAISLNETSTNCTSNYMLIKTLQINYNHSSQFYLVGGCNTSKNFVPTNASQDRAPYEVEIGWSTPLAPGCVSNADCTGWPGTTCNATSDGTTLCHCYANDSWNPSIFICASAETYMPSGRSSLDKKHFYLIAAVVVAVLIIIIGLIYFMRITSKKENWEDVWENPALSSHDNEHQIREFLSTDQFREEDRKYIDVPFLDLEIILTATNNFSDIGKLGKGGFGSVYKGTLPGGQQIAVKRLSGGSRQGLEEFKNEVVLIAKLQHRNLVKLLGYCIEGEEKILLYEFMPNGSLDSFIFDPTRCSLLTWELRFKIIIGIARGMLYLHQDSRLRIIHRDIKTSNVLLDEDMNPKISDFGLARILESQQTEATTAKRHGTYGYMSPEYALNGLYSFKSDVFSFGVVVLEIISGKRNKGSFDVVRRAWKEWSENNALNLMDQALGASCNNTREVVKCINVGLLCVQEDPIDRPVMWDILSILGNENASLPAPKKPEFAVDGCLASTSSPKTSATGKPETINDATISEVQGR